MKKYAIGDWYHMFGPGRRETRCRIVIDLEQSKLVAAQEWTGLKFVDVLGDRLKDLAESVIEVNQAHAKVEEWAPDPDFADELPEWVSPKNLSNYIEHSDTSKTLDDLYASWDRFADVPVSEDGAIEAPFLHFSVGVERETIWRWFESQNPRFVVGDVMNGIRHEDERQAQGNVDTYTDGEVVGVDADGSLVQWNAETGEAYNSGETPESFGAHNLSDMERARLQQAVIGQPEGLSLNTDPTLIEARVMKDYAHYLGKDVLVKGICGFVGDDSTDVELSPPAKVRVEATSEQSLKRWIDGWCDPLYEVTLVENHPQLNGMRSLWIHGPSLHLNGKQTEASDIVSIAEQPKPRQDDSPSP